MTESRLIERVKTLIEPSPAAPVGELPELPEPFALSVSVHEGDTPAKTYVECQLFQKHPNEKQKLYTADQMRAYGEQCWKAGYKHGAWGDKPAVNQQLTTEQLDEREAFEREMSKPPFEFCMDRWPDDVSYAWPGNYAAYHTQCAWDAWQARAALSAGDAVDAQRWKTSELISRTALTPPKHRTETESIAFNAYRKAMESGQSYAACVDAAIDAAMRKEKP